MATDPREPSSPDALFPFSELTLGRPKRRAVADWTLKSLYEAIFGGRFAPGQLLVESELTGSLGVSRQPVREALRQLEHDGLIEPAPGNGNGQRVVVAFGREHVEEIYALRAVLEALSFSHAAPKISDDQLARLETIQERLEARERNRASTDPYDCSLDFSFHEYVCEVAEMKMLQAHLRAVWIRTWALLTQLDIAGTYPTEEEVQDSYRDRRKLIEALRSRQPETAASAAREHVIHRRDQLLAAITDGRGMFRLAAGAAEPTDARRPATLFA